MKKRIIFGVAMAVMLICAIAYAQPYVSSSGSNAASAVIFTGPGNLHGIVVSTDGTNAATIDVYDNTSAAGTKLVPTWVVTSSATDRTQTLGFYPPVRFEKGCYVNLSVAGGGTAAYVAYHTR